MNNNSNVNLYNHIFLFELTKKPKFSFLTNLKQETNFTSEVRIFVVRKANERRDCSHFTRSAAIFDKLLIK